MSSYHRIDNPPQRFSKQFVEWLELPPPAALEVFEERAKSIITENDSPDVGFRYSVNPYRGCFHGCTYCYARPSHQYLDFGAGTDFERKIVVKINAAELLHAEFMRERWAGEPVVFSGNTDCYQPLEGDYQLTRQLLEVCVRFRNPAYIITKGAIVCRDIDLLQELGRIADVHVHVSLAFADDKICRKIEPYTPTPTRRFKVIEELAKAGIPVGIGVAPVIPRLNDEQLPTLLERAANCGATSAFMTLLRLPAEVKETFLQQIVQEFPNRAEKILSGVRRMKEGNLNRSTFGKRMIGSGPEWEALHWLFESSCERFGLRHRRNTTVDGKPIARKDTFRRPTAQLALFE